MDLSKRWIAAGAGVAAVCATTFIARSARSRSAPRALETVAYVDLERYQGRWFEIARYAARFESRCARNTTAEYTLVTDGVLRVENRCTTIDGRVEGNTSWARVSDPETNAKLSLKYRAFAPAGDYWIIDLDDEYRFAAVGEPRRRMLWILSRTPSIDDEVMRGIYMRLQGNGYDTSQLERTLQDGAV
jgi:apolipoprotein D and lipocalin family protein